MLKKSFYARDTVTVAKELLGKILVHSTKGVYCLGMIIETEAYLEDDPASHAFKKTPRSKIMFGKPGHAYVYFTYGNHWMLNAVTEREGKAGAVLIRAVEPLAGIKIMKKRRGIKNKRCLTNGPGKLTEAFGIDGKYNGHDLTTGKVLYIDNNKQKFQIVTTTRVGIKNGADMKLRFYIKGNSYVSKGVNS